MYVVSSNVFYDCIGERKMIYINLFEQFQETQSAWRTVFFVTIALYCIEIVVYTLFGSGEQQPWNNVEEKKEDNSTETKPLNNEEREKANI